jgi:hypothetical protein
MFIVGHFLEKMAESASERLSHTGTGAGARSLPKAARLPSWLLSVLGNYFYCHYLISFQIMQVPRIHLIEKRFEIRPSDNNPGIHESCCWKYLDDETCRRLINGKVYFHLTQATKAYMSGTIVGFKEAGKKRDNSVIILFKKDENEPGNDTLVENPDGWQPIGLEHRGIHPYRQIVF